MLALLLSAHLFCSFFHTSASAAAAESEAGGKSPAAVSVVRGEAAASALEPAPRGAEGPLCDETGGMGVDQRAGAAQFPAWLAIGLAAVVLLWLAPPPPPAWRPRIFAPVAAHSGTRLLTSLCILRI